MLNIQRVLQTNLGYAKVNGNISSCLHITLIMLLVMVVFTEKAS